MKNFSFPPATWVRTALGDVAEIVRGVTYDKAETRSTPAAGYVPILRATNIGPSLTFDDLVYVPLRYVRSEQYLRPGDVVVATSSGSLSVVGKGALVREEVVASFGAFCSVLRPSSAVEPRFLGYYLHTTAYREAVSGLAAGVNINNLRRGHLQELQLWLPPLAEQHRVVAALEEYLSDLDAAVEGLERAQANTRRFLAALIEQRVARIAAASGDMRRLRDLVDLLDQGWSPRCDSTPAAAGEWGVIKTTAVQPLSFQADANKRLPEPLTPRPALILRAGDLLVTRAGPRSRVGVSCVVPNDQPRLMNCDKVYRVRLRKHCVRPEYVAAVLNTPSYLRRLDDLKTGISDSGVNLTQDRFLDLDLPVPALGEQDALLADVAMHQSVVDRTAAELGNQLVHAARLRQAILKRAFEGKLVPQSADDEPPTAQLARVGNTPDATSAPRARRGRKRTTATRERD